MQQLTTEMVEEDLDTRIVNNVVVNETTSSTTAPEETTTSTVEDLIVTEETVDKYDDTSLVFGTSQDAVNFENILKEVTTEADEIVTNKTGGEIVIEQYHNYTQLELFLRSLESSQPCLVTVYSLGNSVEGRALLGLRITAPRGKEERPLGVPMVKYVANMHGDESVGREMLLALAEYLVTNYGVIDRVTKLLDTTEVHLVPSINPDGFERVTRANYNSVDLNRGFPGQEELSLEKEELMEDREKEVAHVMKWILENK